MQQYKQLVLNVLHNGTRKENRTGVDTLSTFNENYEIDLQEGFPLLTTKEVSWKNIIVENLWFLSGKRDISFLHQHNCKFWDLWADEKGHVPSAYGSFWRGYDSHVYGCTIDQIKCVINELKKNPYSRRLVVSAWHPINAIHSSLPPCHLLFIFNVQNFKDGARLCLHLTQRSGDVALGIPYNIAGYSFLMHLISRFTGIPVGIFAHSIVDAHIYTSKPDGSMSEYDHVPGLQEQLGRTCRSLPSLEIDPGITSLDDLDVLHSMSTQDLLNVFRLHNYNPHPPIKFKAVP